MQRMGRQGRRSLRRWRGGVTGAEIAQGEVRGIGFARLQEAWAAEVGTGTGPQWIRDRGIQRPAAKAAARRD